MSKPVAHESYVLYFTSMVSGKIRMYSRGIVVYVIMKYVDGFARVRQHESQSYLIARTCDLIGY